MEAKCNCSFWCARIRQKMSCRPALCTDCHSWRIVCAERGRADWSSLLKVSCCIDTNVEHSFVTHLICGFWRLFSPVVVPLRSRLYCVWIPESSTDWGTLYTASAGLGPWQWCEPADSSRTIIRGSSETAKCVWLLRSSAGVSCVLVLGFVLYRDYMAKVTVISCSWCLVWEVKVKWPSSPRKCVGRVEV